MLSDGPSAIPWHGNTCSVNNHPYLVFFSSIGVHAKCVPVRGAIHNSLSYNGLSQFCEYISPSEGVSAFNVPPRLIWHKLNKGKELELCEGARRCEQLDTSLAAVPRCSHRADVPSFRQVFAPALKHLFREDHPVKGGTRASPERPPQSSDSSLPTTYHSLIHFA